MGNVPFAPAAEEAAAIGQNRKFGSILAPVVDQGLGGFIVRVNVKQDE